MSNLCGYYIWDGEPGPEYEVYDSVNVLAGRIELKWIWNIRFPNTDKGVYAAGDFNIYQL